MLLTEKSSPRRGGCTSGTNLQQKAIEETKRASSNLSPTGTVAALLPPFSLVRSHRLRLSAWGESVAKKTRRYPDDIGTEQLAVSSNTVVSTATKKRDVA